LPSLVLALLIVAVPSTEAAIMTGSLHFRYFPGPTPECDFVDVFVLPTPGVDPDEACLMAWKDWVLSQGLLGPPSDSSSSSQSNSTGGS